MENLRAEDGSGSQQPGRGATPTSNISISLVFLRKWCNSYNSKTGSFMTDMQLGQHCTRKKTIPNPDVAYKYIFASMHSGIAFMNGYTVWGKWYVNVGAFLEWTPSFWTLPYWIPTGLPSLKLNSSPQKKSAFPKVNQSLNYHFSKTSCREM